MTAPRTAQHRDPIDVTETENRRYRRHPLTLLGRFMRSNKTEYPCKLINISLGNATLHSPVEPEIDERIIAYFDHIGGLEGKVERVFDGGFAIDLDISDHKREKLAAQLTWIINRHELDRDSLRRHPRYELTDTSSKLKLPDGHEASVQVLDVSISGASIRTDLRLPLGAEVQLGKLRARIVRHHEQGFAVEFLDIQKPDALRKYFG